MPRKKHPIGVGMTPCTTKFGRFLRELRLELELSQGDVATVSGMSQAYHSQLEIGLTKHLDPEHPEYFNGLVKALKCRRSELAAVTPLKPQPKPKTPLARLINSRRKNSD